MLRSDTVGVFKLLEAEGFLVGFDYEKENCAYEIVKLLGWDNPNQFVADMQSVA